MEGRMAMLAFIAAVAAVNVLGALPGAAARAGLALVCLASGALHGRLRFAHGRQPGGPRMRAMLALTLCLCTASGGGLYAIERARQRLDDALPAAQKNQVVRTTFRVVSLREDAPDAVRFDAEVIDAASAGIPRRIRVSWPLPMRGDDAAQRSVTPGQQWRAALVLKPPHAAQNPYAADGEARLFQRNIRATGTVRGKPRFMGDEGDSFGIVAVHRLRARLRARMHAALDQARYGPVIVALALGDQAGIARTDWRVFNVTGITHLVSISGLHVTLVAGLVGTTVGWAWRRARWRGLGLGELMPAQIAGIAAAVLAAWCYCLLAGWGIPARRTFFTLAVAGGAAMCRLPLSPSRILLMAACAVVALDPWAPIAPGFWLSFGAVAAVLAWGHASRMRADPDAPAWRRLMRGWGQANRLQWVVTLSLTPVLAFLTQQVTLVSPLANAIAIPAVSFVVTPLALACAGLCAIPGAAPAAALMAQAAHGAFALTMRPVEWLAARDWAVCNVAAPPLVLLAVALGGIGWALLPPGMASRRWAWLLLLPALCWRPSRPGHGDWMLTALDVGQGGAVVVETARHTLVFDTGPLHRNGTDGAERVLWPYLRARGIGRIDTLVVSHGDLDHAGGLDTLLRAVPVVAAYAPFDVHARLRRDARVRDRTTSAPAPSAAHRCQAGQAWESDGVRFEFLHPQDDAKGAATPRPRTASRVKAARGRSRGGSNAGGCVLLVQGRHHAALLPGDVGVAEEQRFASRLAAAMAPASGVDLVMAPHHGSATSSGAALVEATRPSHVVAQVGYLNRFRHPAGAVLRRWRRAGATFWRTDRDGAVIASSSAAGLQVQGQRDRARRYWHGPRDR